MTCNCDSCRLSLDNYKLITELYLLAPLRRTLIQHVATRLREVHSLRTLHKQLTQLLSINEQDELRHELVLIFDTVKIIFMNEYSTVWAVCDFGMRII